MKLLAILLVCTIGMVYSASLGTKPQCSICKNTVDWVRSNENMLSVLKMNDEVPREVIELIESDRPSQNVCGLVAMCETSRETVEYLTNLGLCGCYKGHCICHHHGHHHKQNY